MEENCCFWWFCLLFVMFWGMDIVFLLTFPVILQTILCILSGKIQYWWVLSSISLKQFRNDKYNYNHKNSTFQHPPSVANGQKRLVLKKIIVDSALLRTTLNTFSKPPKHDFTLETATQNHWNYEKCTFSYFCLKKSTEPRARFDTPKSRFSKKWKACFFVVSQLESVSRIKKNKVQNTKKDMQKSKQAQIWNATKCSDFCGGVRFLAICSWSLSPSGPR